MNENKFSIIRTHSAGVWFGNVKEYDRKNNFLILQNARRIYYWSGAASLSQMATEGVKNPSQCKFAVTITDEDGVGLPQVIEILPCTLAAVNNIKAVKEWKI